MTAFAIPALTWVLWATATILMSADQQGAGFVVGMAMMFSGFWGCLFSIVLCLVTIAICLIHFRYAMWKDTLLYLALACSAIVFSIGTLVGITSLVFAGWPTN